MKKVLILSYFFPPSNFAGSYRIKAWAEHLHKFGYYPIVVTRHWAENETDYTAISDKKEITREVFNNYTVYRLPYKGSTRDRLLKAFGAKATFLGKVFSFFQVIGQNYFLHSIPYRNLYFFTRKLLKEQGDINLLLTSGRPFVLFRMANLLKKEFPHINWVADYRDPWNSWTEIRNNFKLRFLRMLELSAEKRWIGNATFFTTCSEGFRDNINHIHLKEGFVVTNGFERFFESEKAILNDKQNFVIGFIGTLYDNQKIEVFLKGLKIYFEQNSDARIKIHFLGLDNLPAQKRRIMNFLKGYESRYKIFPWIEKKRLLNIASGCDYFLLCGIPEQKGRHTAKLFDYFSLRRPIILCPSDHDLLEKTIKETKSGVVLDSPESVEKWLKISYNQWLESGRTEFTGRSELLENFLYEKQVGYLARLIDAKCISQ